MPLHTIPHTIPRIRSSHISFTPYLGRLATTLMLQASYHSMNDQPIDESHALKDWLITDLEPSVAA